MNNFDSALQVVLGHEGGYVNNPADRGGATNMGITQSTLDSWNSAQGIASYSVDQIDVGTAGQIYKQNYWRPFQLDGISDQKLCEVVFDLAVLVGVGKMTRVIQKICEVDVDGDFGPISTLAFQEYASRNPTSLSWLILLEIECYFAMIVVSDNSQLQFLAGWTNRIRSFL